jgi:ribosomal protein S18 acetylase RimI-like enzyme
MTGVPAPIRLGPADASRYSRLRRRMLVESPWSFSASPEDDAALEPARLAELLRDEESAIFAIEASAVERAGGGRRAASATELIAAATVVRMKRPKFAHRARIWGVFVEPEHRGRGLDRAVMEAAIGAARGWPGVDYVDLAVSANAPAAEHLYRRLGFVAWGREPEATEHAGRRHDEIHMTLRLADEAGG